MTDATMDHHHDDAAQRPAATSEIGCPARDIKTLARWPEDVLATIVGFAFHQLTLTDPLAPIFGRIRLQIPRIRHMPDTHKSVFSQVCERYPCIVSQVTPGICYH